MLALTEQILLRGYRRVEALWIAIERKFSPETFYPEMEISAIEVESKSGYLDYLIRSVCDNEVRLGLDDDEKLLAAEKVLVAGASSSRAARALGVSATHFARYQRRIASPVMRAHIAAGHLTPTDADNLLEIASRNNCVKQLETDFDHIVDKIENHISALRAEAIINQNEFKEDKLGVVSKHFNSGHVRSWIKNIKESKSPDWEAEPTEVGWTYECSFDLRHSIVKELNALDSQLKLGGKTDYDYQYRALIKQLHKVYLTSKRARVLMDNTARRLALRSVIDTISCKFKQTLRNYPKTLRMFMWANGLQCIVPSGRAVDTNTEHNLVGSARGN
ncbi:MAG TPA: hypothetical protein VJY15_12875 [Candidatus Acidoferrum sp.]|nr:hypothetical protein [Candidatus Acidoferrum sp.]